MLAKERMTSLAAAAIVVLLVAGQVSLAGEASLPDPFPNPDGKPADLTKPVKVFILMGQSNMVGMGKVAGEDDGTLEHAVKKKGKYPYLVDDAGKWTVRTDVRNVRVMDFKDLGNDWLTPEGLKSIGPELGIGYALGPVLDEPVMLLKSCIGNRSLGWDLLPPGSKPYTYNGKTYPGYRGTPDNPSGTGEKPEGWYAGKQYDADVGSAKEVLESLDKYYPGAKTYEVAGFFWWQGDKDMRDGGHAGYYQKNLQQLTVALRKDFDAPEARFVFASLGQTKEGATGGDGQILKAMKNVATLQRGKGAFVYTHPLSMGGSSSGHYNNNAETYMNVGEVMGRAMAELLTQPVKATPVGEMRTWTSLGGRTIKARFLADKEDQVMVETEDGTTLTFSLDHFSKADQAYLKKQ